MDRSGDVPDREYLLLVAGSVFAGIGMGLFFAPIANVVLGAVRSF
jgi:hypothetical protein